MMLNKISPRQSLNKSYLKVKPNRSDIERFKANLIRLIDRLNDSESEEYHKNLLSDFLKDTYYNPRFFINTKGRNDLVIHNGSDGKSPVGVIVEAKKPGNKSEMISLNSLNAKAFHELILYFLRERITHDNKELKQVIITNVQEWFIFDAILFDRLFAQNKNFVRHFTDFEAGRLSDTKTDFFYKHIAEPFLAELKQEIPFTHFALADYSTILRNDDPADDTKLISLYKLLSPEHILKLPFANDSNSLDKTFYSELLHLIGLDEYKDKGKKLIGRPAEGKRNRGSLLEDTIIQLDSLDKLSRIPKNGQYGETTQERLFNVALELNITWINRILFLKLLEAQLLAYHKGDRSYAFLNSERIHDFDDLNTLFFQVLARKNEDRNEDVKSLFDKVPYLNSSLFEPTELEHNTLFISNLRDEKTIPIHAQSVLKDENGKRLSGEITTLRYLFAFLDAYDFSSEGSEKIQEDNKTLINASVLGLIFEKINGYKDGSFFTPGFITMYMCRETIRKAVVQKFNEARLTHADRTRPQPLSRGEKLGALLHNEQQSQNASEANLTQNQPLSRGEKFGSAHKSELASEKKSPLENEASAIKSPLERGFRGVSKPARRKIIPYNPALKQLARNLRNNSTKSEILLWKELKGKVLDKYDFHRQKPLDNFIADFFCHELQLVIEIDGASHEWEETQKKDFIKENRLNELGLNVLRFPDSDVFDEMDATLETIFLYIQCFEAADFSSFITEDSPLNPISGCKPILPSEEEELPELPTIPAYDYPHFETLDDVYEEIGNGQLFSRNEANSIINSLKICDPAVGSGHFLVSALNEIIAIKHDLKILQDRNGKRLKEYAVTVENDELIVSDEDGKLFEYKQGFSESQRVQETLFHEKQTIIENCLFGVDINPNSVKICRLRLWIELLKNAYYVDNTNEPNLTHPQPLSRGEETGASTQKSPLERGFRGVSKTETKTRYLETLPNIDINIKTGNSLVSRFAMDADLKDALKKSKWNIHSYRAAVATYRNAVSKDQKREMEALIASIKGDFRSEITKNDPKLKRLQKAQGELLRLTTQTDFFERSKKQEQEWEKQVKSLSTEIATIETEIEAIKANKIYENAFEWRFEFPEVLNDEGDFVGFDVVIGNPPYGANFNDGEKEYIRNSYKSYQYKFDSYVYFIEKGLNILKSNGLLEFITPILWLSLDNCIQIRSILLKEFNLKRLFIHGEGVFEEAVVNTLSFQVVKSKATNKLVILREDYESNVDKFNWIDDESLKIDFKMTEIEKCIIDKIRSKSKLLLNFGTVIQGITPYDSYRGQSKEIIKNKAYHFDYKKNETCGKWLDGKNLNRYIINWDNKWLSYGNWLAAPREKKYFEGRRILFREIPGKGKRIQANIAIEEFYYGHSISPFKPFDEFENDLEFILGVVNSKVISWYGNLVLPNFGKDVFPKLNPNDIKELPIPNVNIEVKAEISNLVNQIFTLKNKDSESDISKHEKQIDHLVYQLYRLEEEEIKIINNEL